MKKLFIILLSLLLLVGCDTAFEPEMCSISVESSQYYTFELEKNVAPLGSLVKITVTPIEHYIITGMDYYTTYFKDTENENTFYFLVDRKKTSVSFKLEKEKKEYIQDLKNFDPNKKYEVTFPDGREHYIGDKVFFSIEPDRFYYLDEDSVSITYKNNNDEDIHVEVTEISENNYSFIMPSDISDSSYVYLDCTPKFGFAIEGIKENYIQGEEISFRLENVFEDEPVDIYVYDNFDNTEKSLLYTNTISGTYTIDLSKIAVGKNTIIVTPYDNQNWLIKNDIYVNLSDTPEGWNTTGIIISKGSSEYTVYLNNNKTKADSLMVTYYFENDASNTLKKSFNLWGNSDYFRIYKQNFSDGNIVLWVNDSYNKLISPKVTINFNSNTNSES
ncbi:MAG: hypothetical protein J6C25_07310 [Treponema sp.]|nr:hypothetical protein [Treponema sp.]MBP3562363.1 hypothetical protein [Treponema sp.]